jgi:hypothetical protein
VLEPTIYHPLSFLSFFIFLYLSLSSDRKMKNPTLPVEFIFNLGNFIDFPVIYHFYPFYLSLGIYLFLIIFILLSSFIFIYLLGSDG